MLSNHDNNFCVQSRSCIILVIYMISYINSIPLITGTEVSCRNRQNYKSLIKLSLKQLTKATLVNSSLSFHLCYLLYFFHLNFIFIQLWSWLYKALSKRRINVSFTEQTNTYSQRSILDDARNRSFWIYFRPSSFECLKPICTFKSHWVWRQ